MKTFRQIQLEVGTITTADLYKMGDVILGSTQGMSRLEVGMKIATEIHQGRWFWAPGQPLPGTAGQPVVAAAQQAASPQPSAHVAVTEADVSKGTLAALARDNAMFRADISTLDKTITMARQSVVNDMRAMESKIISVNDATMAEVNKLSHGIETLIKAPKTDKAQINIEVQAAVNSILAPFKSKIETLAQTNPVAVSEIAEIAKYSLESVKHVFGIDLKDRMGNSLSVKTFANPRAPSIDPNFIWSKNILSHLIQSQDSGENIWFGGEKGTGKSETARQFAARTGRPFTRINFHKHSTADDFIGTTGYIPEQGTVFDPKDFLIAYTTAGSIILLDEPSNCDPGELAILNGFLEPNAAISLGGKVWRRAADVLVFAADNTSLNGDVSGRYAGTREMNSAFGDRFARLIQFGFMQAEFEIDAVMRHTGCNEALATHVIEMVNVCRSKVSSGDIIDAPSIRSVVAFIRALKYHDIDEAWATTFSSKQPPESMLALESIKVATLNRGIIDSNL